MIKKIRFAMMAAFGTKCHIDVHEQTLALNWQPVIENITTFQSYNISNINKQSSLTILNLTNIH